MIPEKSIMRVCHEHRSDLHFKKMLEKRRVLSRTPTRKQQAAENSRCKCKTQTIIDGISASPDRSVELLWRAAWRAILRIRRSLEQRQVCAVSSIASDDQTVR